MHPMKELTKRQQRILDEVTKRYLGSSDFNGVPLLKLSKDIKVIWPTLSKDIETLIQKDKARVAFSSTDINTHIIRIGFESVEAQLENLAKTDEHACVYPTTSYLEHFVD